jgi:hypothetical protein
MAGQCGQLSDHFIEAAIELLPGVERKSAVAISPVLAVARQDRQDGLDRG